MTSSDWDSPFHIVIVFVFCLVTLVIIRVKLDFYCQAQGLHSWVHARIGGINALNFTVLLVILMLHLVLQIKADYMSRCGIKNFKETCKYI